MTYIDKLWGAKKSPEQDKLSQDELCKQFFFQAVKHDNVIVLQDLIDKGFDINMKDRNGYTPLMLATMLEKEKIQGALLKNGAIN